MRRGRVELSNEVISDILGGVLKGDVSREDAMYKMEITADELDKLLDIKQKFMKSAHSIKYKVGQKNIDPNKYDLAVQKMISYKGTIRPMTLDVASPGGGSYKLRVINIYVKPNFTKTVYDKKTGAAKQVEKDNIRIYEEKAYMVNKGDIAKGSSNDNYYPDKARWSKPSEKPSEKRERTAAKKSEEDIIQLRRKRKSRIIKRYTVNKAIKRHNRCKCRTTKKR